MADGRSWVERDAAVVWHGFTQMAAYAENAPVVVDRAEGHYLYDAFFPRAEEAIAYCDRFPLDDLPDDALHLLQLLYSLVMASFPVEAWRQPHVPDSGAAYLDLLIEPIP